MTNLTDPRVDPETTICHQSIGDGDICGEPAVATDTATATGRCRSCLDWKAEYVRPVGREIALA